MGREQRDQQGSASKKDAQGDLADFEWVGGWKYSPDLQL